MFIMFHFPLFYVTTDVLCVGTGLTSPRDENTSMSKDNTSSPARRQHPPRRTQACQNTTQGQQHNTTVCNTHQQNTSISTAKSPPINVMPGPQLNFIMFPIFSFLSFLHPSCITSWQICRQGLLQGPFLQPFLSQR